MATSVKSPAAETNAKQGRVFDPSDGLLASLTGTRGRKATDSVYLDEVTAALKSATHKTVADAIENKDAHGISLTAGLTGAWVGAQLRKAAKQAQEAGVANATKRITIFVRDAEEHKGKDFPNGYVVWVVTAE